ncbi:MAG: DUF4124 domain-containing protein [Zoogloeaceae bacterium]|jgi:hypothetical protein|nr:DUF4124 domain-containing protein [Zoogloeaceae bacterium]
MKTSTQLFCAACLLLGAQGVGAEIYKCVDRNGVAMLSNLPCASSQRPAVSTEKSPAPAEQSAANRLSANPLATSVAESPKPLARAPVEDLFARFSRACSARDGNVLLEQFSKRMQAYLNRAQQIPLYERIAYMCDSVARYNIKTKGKSFGSIYNENGQTPAATPGGAEQSTVSLCAYGKPESGKKPPCAPGMTIVFEDGLLKVDER